MVCTIGADPEFLLLGRENKLISATSCMDDLDKDTNNIVGYDHDGRVGEIRPKYARNAIQLSANVRYCLRVAYGDRIIENNMPKKAVGGSGVLAVKGSTDYKENFDCVGGHIHFGIKEQQPLLHAFDAFSILILQIEDNPQNKMRRETNYCYGENLDGSDDNFYGQLSSTREQEWGFEYRCPASWLVSPLICYGILCGYHAIASAYMNKCNRPNKLIEIGRELTDEDKMCFNAGDYKHFLPIIPNIVSSIRDLPAYKINQEYKEKIDYILDMVANGEKWRERRDIFSTWSVKNSRNCLIKYSGDFFMENFDDINAPYNKDKALYVVGRAGNNYDKAGYMRVYSDSNVVLKVAKEYLTAKRIPKILVRKEEKMVDSNISKGYTELQLGLRLREKTRLCRGLIKAVRDKLTENTIKQPDTEDEIENKKIETEDDLIIQNDLSILQNGLRRYEEF